MKMLKFKTIEGAPLYVVPDKITSVFPSSKFNGVHLNYVGGAAQVYGSIDTIIKQIDEALKE